MPQFNHMFSIGTTNGRGADGAGVLIVGAGPAGAVTALALARRGVSVTLIDRSSFPRDKVCGEGLMPPGVDALDRLGLLGPVLAQGARWLTGVTHVSGRDGTRAFTPFPKPNARSRWVQGLGVRRLAFDRILMEAVVGEPTACVRERVHATGVIRDPGGRVRGAVTSAGPIRAAVTVAADGLHSRMRASAGWTARYRGPDRYGLAGHWRVDTSARREITVTLGAGHEWYEAAVGPDELLVSVLGARRFIGGAHRAYADLARTALPGLRGAELVRPPLAAGRFHQRPAEIAGDGLFLVGDAAGYHDPTTAEGLALGLLLGEALAGIISRMLRGEITESEAVRRYRSIHRGLWRNRRRITALALFMASHPRLHHRVISRRRDGSPLVGILLGIGFGYWGFPRLALTDRRTTPGRSRAT